MRLIYEPSSKLLHNSAKQLFLNQELCRAVQLEGIAKIQLPLGPLGVNFYRPKPRAVRVTKKRGW